MVIENLLAGANSGGNVHKDSLILPDKLHPFDPSPIQHIQVALSHLTWEAALCRDRVIPRYGGGPARAKCPLLLAAALLLCCCFRCKPHSD